MLLGDTNVNYVVCVDGSIRDIKQTVKTIGACSTLDEEKNGYVARDQLLYAL